MVEYTSEHDNRVEITRAVVAGENIVPRGAEAREGSTLIAARHAFERCRDRLAASVGKSKLQVYKRPRVAVLTTGDEIVDINATPGPTQIRNSNSYSLAVQIAQAGGDPILLPIAPDEPQALRRLIEDGLKSDLLLHDRWSFHGPLRSCRAGARRMNAEFFFTGAKIQPGRPVVFGKCAAQATGQRSVFFWTSRESGLHHGDLRTLRTPHAGNARRHVPAQTEICACEAEVRDPREARIEALLARNPLRRIRRHARWNWCAGKARATSPPPRCANCYIVSARRPRANKSR